MSGAASSAASWPKLNTEIDPSRCQRWALPEEVPAAFCAQDVRGCVQGVAESSITLMGHAMLERMLEAQQVEIDQLMDAGAVTRSAAARADELQQLVERCSRLLEMQQAVIEPARAAYEHTLDEAARTMREAGERRRQQLVAAQRALAERLADAESELDEDAEEAHWAAVGRGCAKIPRMLAELV